MTWIDILFQVCSSEDEDDFGGNLQLRVSAICPEYATAIHNWQHMRAVPTRYSQRCLSYIEEKLDSTGVPVHILPQVWFCEKYTLLTTKVKAKKADHECLSEDEQFAAVARILGAFVAASVKHENELTTTMLGNEVL